MIPDGLSCLWIQPECRLVEEQDLWLVEHSARDLEPALHASRICPYLRAGAIGQLQELKHLIDALAADQAGHAVDEGVELEVLDRKSTRLNSSHLRISY